MGRDQAQWSRETDHQKTTVARGDQKYYTAKSLNPQFDQPNLR